MPHKTLVLTSFVAIVSATASQAADAIIYQEPTPVAAGMEDTAAFSWGGSFVGAQAGYGWAKAKGGSSLIDHARDAKGFLGGIYTGYNMDIGDGVIFGAEGEIGYTDVSKKINFSRGGRGDVGLGWNGALRARAGLAVDRFLPYVAGGLAIGRVKAAYADGANGVSVSKTLTGWTAGAGVDYAATDNVTLRLEYRFTDFGDVKYTIGAGDYNNKIRSNDIRLGAAYKF